MDNPVITEEREQVPDWAKGFSPDPNRASEKQMGFIESLLAERELARLSEEQINFLTSERPMMSLTKDHASKIITALLKLPKKPKEQQSVATSMAERFAVGVPAGRYAVEADSGELRFYKVWISRDGLRLNVYVEHGPDESDLKYHKTVLGVLGKIQAVGVRACAIRYGMEIGECSNCGRRLTNEISRALGIGPVCGGRMFGDDFKVEVKTVRADLKAQGIDPNAEVS